MSAATVEGIGMNESEERLDEQSEDRVGVMISFDGADRIPMAKEAANLNEVP